VLRLDRRIEGRQLPFEMVQQRIADYLQAASWQRALAQYIRVLAGQAEIAGIDLGGTETPLVQ
jgi:peptidyl-prolyl cis-trans isomerase C